MVNIWLTSDTHFKHENILTFTDGHGQPLRPFRDVSHMDETLIANWNAVVAPQDHVYHLGDVTMLRGARRVEVETVLDRLNGHKRLILGNHDLNEVEWYLRWFEKVMSYRVFKDGPGRQIILSHVPIHAGSLGKFSHNIHGHTHANHVMFPGLTERDDRYINVCVEKTNYTPVALDRILTTLP